MLALESFVGVRFGDFEWVRRNPVGVVLGVLYLLNVCVVFGFGFVAQIVRFPGCSTSAMPRTKKEENTKHRKQHNEPDTPSREVLMERTHVDVAVNQRGLGSWIANT